MLHFPLMMGQTRLNSCFILLCSMERKNIRNNLTRSLFILGFIGLLRIELCDHLHFKLKMQGQWMSILSILNAESMRNKGSDSLKWMVS